MEPLAEVLQKLVESLLVHSSLADHVQLQARLFRHSHYHRPVASVDVFLVHCQTCVLAAILFRLERLFREVDLV